MRWRAATVVLLLLAGFTCGSPADKSPQPALLALPLFPVPSRPDKMPLTQALTEIGARVRGGYVLFGTEVALNENGTQPSVRLDLPSGATLGDAVRHVLSQLEGYEFRIASNHIINIYPQSARKSRDNPLNVRVQRFNVAGAYPSDILSRPVSFIPELHAHLRPPPQSGQPSGSFGPGISGGGPTISLNLNNVTVRDILNAVSHATEQFPPEYSPVGWVYSFRPDPKLPAGGEHSWTFHWSAPAGWKEAAENPTKPRN